MLEEESLTEEQTIADNQKQAAQWAAKLLKRDDWVILDTETTGLYQAEVCQLAVIDCAGEPKLNTLIKPTVSIPPSSTRVHGISDETVRDAPIFPDVYPQLKDAIADKLVVIYNAGFDTAILDYCCNLDRLPSLWRGDNTQCAMHWYSQWVGDYSDYHGNYRWQKLRGDHTALGDCREVLRLIQLMAENARERLDNLL